MVADFFSEAIHGREQKYSEFKAVIEKSQLGIFCQAKYLSQNKPTI